MKSSRSIVSMVWLVFLLAVPAFAANPNLSMAKRPKQDADSGALKAASDRYLKSLWIGTETHQCNHSDPIACNQTINGSLTTADCRLGDNTYVDDYTFNGTSGQQLTITQTSAALDSYLFLINPSGTVVAQDDDSGGGVNSRIVFTLNASGAWHIIANTFDASVPTGNYTLSVTCGTPTQCTLNSNPITCNGATVNGTLSTSDCTLADNSYYDEWTFSGTSGQQVTITQRSSAVDSYLILVNPSGTAVDEDDDDGGGLDSRITFTLNATGTWRIFANSFGAGETGAYTLQLTCTGGGGGTCTTGGTQLCLNNNRFRVTVNWRDFSGNTGSGNAVGMTNDTGYFWFFNAANVELVVKVLDATSVNNRFWVYYGALTNVEYTMTVTDTLRGTVRTYNNPSGTFASAGDVNAFAP